MFNNKVYHRIDALSGSVATLRAEGVKYNEIAEVESRAGTSLAQVIKLDGPNVTLQIFAGARGVDTSARVRFLGETMKIPFSVDLLGRAFTGAGVPRDGDVVVAMLGDEATVKTYDVDETGAAWLVPANPNYRPILINDYEDCYIVGTVERVEKAAPHTSHRDTAALINQERRLRQQEGRSVDDQVLRTALHNISPRVKSARQWFAVYRAMVDAKVISDGDFMAFKGKLTEIMGEGTPCIDLREIRRLAVQSFSKPVVLWNIDNAPVQSRSFYEYQELATDFLRMLRA